MQFSYTTDELSRVLGISSARIRQLIGAGKLKARRVGRRVWVIQRRAIESMLRKRMCCARSRLDRERASAMLRRLRCETHTEKECNA
ncbi:MAG: hypothetical protein KatS3mg038_3079 [Candidatus Kapaibacterium sp.]|nr:MAG: hypothetical protein KatS3mg038_1667 [Candidatus Kapabacteria bacterium]GIV52558.1 MAG: hypothetical protein KatS3mg038_3079 [Candidatus Kapabacteria bacterium]